MKTGREVNVTVRIINDEQASVTVKLLVWSSDILKGLGHNLSEQARVANHIALKVHDAYESAKDDV